MCGTTLWECAIVGLAMQYPSSLKPRGPTGQWSVHVRQCGQHRSCEDIVWRQAAKAEASCRAGHAQDSAAGAVLFDVRKFFESFDISLLEKRAAMLGIPARLIKLSANMYRGLRYLRMGAAW